MCVNDRTDFRSALVYVAVHRSFNRGPEISLNKFPVEVNYDEVIGVESQFTESAWCDNHVLRVRNGIAYNPERRSHQFIFEEPARNIDGLNCQIVDNVSRDAGQAEL